LYYKSVNRGLSFTKPGLYAFGFVLLVGMIAIATGVNGLYLVLAIGLGGFIISGLLSEKAMRSCRVSSVAGATVDADTPLEMRVQVENRSTWFNVMGMRVLIVKQAPRLRLFASPVPSLLKGAAPVLAPNITGTIALTGAGLPRGTYDKLSTMQMTTFPFGLLEKFKVDVLVARLVVAPRLDRELLEQLMAALEFERLRRAADLEFIGHRRYMPRDSLRHLDRKKSAGRPTSEWVVKQFRAPDLATSVRVRAPWTIATGAKDETAYEEFLRRARTACQAAVDAGMRFELCLQGDEVVATSLEGALAALAGAPSWTSRAAWPAYLREVLAKAEASEPTERSGPSSDAFEVGLEGVRRVAGARQAA
jgi:hypothetical protein